MNYKLKIHSLSANATTGHHIVTLSVVALNKDGEPEIVGVPESFGIEAMELSQRFNGDEMAWLKWIKPQLIGRHEKRRGVNLRLTQHVGKIVDI